MAQPATEENPGEGIICTWMINALVAEYGRRCVAGEYPKLQVELERADRLLEAYVATNSKPPMTDEQVQAFKRRHGVADAPLEEICEGWGQKMYPRSELLASEVRRYVDALVARPGEPTWGGCF